MILAYETLPIPTHSRGLADAKARMEIAPGVTPPGEEDREPPIP